MLIASKQIKQIQRFLREFNIIIEDKCEFRIEFGLANIFISFDL